MASPGLRCLSNRCDASVLIFNSVRVFRIFAGRKLADSKRIVVVLSVTSECNPPMIPANPIGFSSSAITSISFDKVRFSSSRVMRISLSFALRIFTVEFCIFVRSKACNGWPVSSITKFVISTILFMGL